MRTTTTTKEAAQEMGQSTKQTGKLVLLISAIITAVLLFGVAAVSGFGHYTILGHTNNDVAIMRDNYTGKLYTVSSTGQFRAIALP
jgi:hypothetical protein